MKKELPQTETISSKNASPAPLSAAGLLLRSTGLAVLMALGLLVITGLIVAGIAYQKLQIFLSSAGITQTELKSYIQDGWRTDLNQQDDVTTFLLLGVDTVANKQDAPPLTDTMLLLSVNHNVGTIKTLSLPRDLWSEEYKTKINALYVYGEDRYPDSPQQFSKEVIQSITGVPVHYTVVVTLEMLAELVDILGGVEINVPKSFTDTEFPRTDVDVSSTKNSTDLYQTITFQKGTERMNGERVLQYIRSRHSEGDTGTDTDRTQRQQLVISSIAQSIQSKETLLDPKKIGALYQWYAKHLKFTLPEKDIIAFAKSLFPHRNNIAITSNSLTVYPDDPNGLLEHPPTIRTDDQWVYTIREPDTFKKTVYSMLFQP